VCFVCDRKPGFSTWESLRCHYTRTHSKKKTGITMPGRAAVAASQTFDVCRPFHCPRTQGYRILPGYPLLALDPAATASSCKVSPDSIRFPLYQIPPQIPRWLWMLQWPAVLAQMKTTTSVETLRSIVATPKMFMARRKHCVGNAQAVRVKAGLFHVLQFLKHYLWEANQWLATCGPAIRAEVTKG
jgi:hypothetical protein